MELKLWNSQSCIFLTLLVYIQDKSNFKYLKSFFYSLMYVVPKGKNRDIYTNFLDKNPIDKYINLTQWLKLLYGEYGDVTLPHKKNVDNIDPNIWGPHGWEFLMVISYYYDNDDVNFKHYKKFFESLKHLLPCLKCRTNYINYLNCNPLTKHTNLLKWLIILHNKSSSRILDYNKVFTNIKKNYSIYTNYVAI